MKAKGILSLLLIAAVLACLFAGCGSGRAKVDWETYDGTTRSLYLSGSGLEDKDIAPLQDLTGLASLSLWKNKISDLCPLKNLTSLKSLDLSGNRISDLSPLTGLTNLTALDLGGNQISDLTPLAKLTSLTELRLWGNKISDLSPLTGLTNLTTLDLDSNSISNLTPLTGLANLAGLYLDGNQISNLTPLTKLTNLKYLKVRNNKIADWSPVAHVMDVQGNPGKAVPVTKAAAKLKTGRIFYVSLEETQSIPMRWKAYIADESLVRLICTDVKTPWHIVYMSGSPGGKRIFYFEALGPGECTIDMYLLPINRDYDIAQISPDCSYTITIED